MLYALSKIFQVNNLYKIQIIQQKKLNMSMFTSKAKIRQQYLEIYEIISKEKYLSDNKSIQLIQQKGLQKSAIDISISILLNYTISIQKKINCLFFVKALFQTADPIIIEQSLRFLPILVDIIRFPIVNKIPVTYYFLKKQERIQFEPESAQKYIRLCSQILKQWNQYMIDCKQQDSNIIAIYNDAQRKGIPQYKTFQYFTMKDYIQFRRNWMRRKRKNFTFNDKMQFYNLLSNDSNYSKNISIYKNNLSQNSDLIVQEIYSLLINHLAPIEIKRRCLKCMRQLYQQANLLFLEKIQNTLISFLNYMVNLFLKNELPIEKYFERIQKRIGVESSESKAYITELFLTIKQWDKYNENKKNNPYEKLRIKIESNQLLAVNQRNLFTVLDLKRFLQNSQMGKHRQKEYQSQNNIDEYSKPNSESGQKKYQQNSKKKNVYSDSKKNEQFNSQINPQYKVTNSKNSKVQIFDNSQLQLVNESQSKSPYEVNKNLGDKKIPSKRSLLVSKQKELFQQIQKKQLKTSNYRSQYNQYDSNLKKMYKSPTNQKNLEYSGYKLSEMMKRREEKLNKR